MVQELSYLERRLAAAEELLAAKDALSIAISVASGFFDGACPAVTAAYGRVRLAELNYGRILREGEKQ